MTESRDDESRDGQVKFFFSIEMYPRRVTEVMDMDAYKYLDDNGLIDKTNMLIKSPQCNWISPHFLKNENNGKIYIGSSPIIVNYKTKYSLKACCNIVYDNFREVIMRLDIKNAINTIRHSEANLFAPPRKLIDEYPGCYLFNTSSFANASPEFKYDYVIRWVEVRQF